MKNTKLSIVMRILGALCFICTLGLQTVRPATYVVSSAADSGPNTLRQAIIDANNNSGADTIIINAGVTMINLMSTLDIDDDGLVITGPAAKVTIDGGASSRVLSINNIGAGGNTKLEHLIIQNGSSGGNGAGVAANGNGILRIENCEVIGNVAFGAGGGVWSQSGDVVVSNCVFRDNTSAVSGGAIDGPQMTITSSSFENNSVVVTSFGEGGAISTTVDVSITNCTFFNNQATASGGAVSGAATIINSTIYQNIANSNNTGIGSGGGLNVFGATLKNNIVFGNTRGTGGSAISDDIAGSVSFGDRNLVGTCSGCAAGIVDFGSDPNLSTAQSCDGLLYFLPQSPSDAIDNGIVDVDTPTEDMCGNAWGSGSINLGNAEDVTPLPVTLLDFQAQRVLDGEVLLTWSTSTEIDNAGFEIEESVDGSSFDQIGFVEGAGNSTAINAYSYRVITSKSRYYRFKQVDFDGTYAYSPVRFVTDSDVWGKEPVIYPNPTRGVVFIAQVSNDELIRLDMMDVSGKQLDALHGTRPSVEQQLQKRLAHLPKGIYTLRLRTRDGVYLKKVIKE